MFDTKAELKSAVDEWMINATNASSVYGHISAWDTSRVTDMMHVFCGDEYASNCNIRNKEFNDDINSWNVSGVTRMESMFNPFPSVLDPSPSGFGAGP